MATFGAINSPAPNVLFNPMAVDQAVQQRQHNALLVQQGMEDRAQAKLDREREEVGRVSASLLSLPEADRPAAYASARQELQGRGLAMRAPEQYPGHAQIEQLARAALPAKDQFALAEKAQARQEMNALLGGLLGGMGGGAGTGTGPMGAGASIAGASQQVPASSPMPASGAAVGGYGGPTNDYAAGEAKRAALLGADPGTLANVSAQQSPIPERPGGYRNNPGVVGQNVGIAPPTGRIAAIDPAAAAQIALAVRSGNPMAAATTIGQVSQQRAMAQERAIDNARADAQFGLSQQTAMRQAAAQEQSMQLARENAERQGRLETVRIGAEQRRAEAEQERAKAAGVPSGYRRKDDGGLEPIPGGPADPSAKATSTISANDRTKLRDIETQAQGIMGALDTYQEKRASAGTGERVQSAMGMSTGLNSTYSNAALLAKGQALFDLGVLNGPDLDIIRRTLADPGTIAGGLASQSTVNEQVGLIKGLLNQRLATARQQYGGAAPQAAGPAGADGGTPLVVPPPAARGGAHPPLPPGFQLVQ